MNCKLLAIAGALSFTVGCAAPFAPDVDGAKVDEPFMVAEIVRSDVDGNVVTGGMPSESPWLAQTVKASYPGKVLALNEYSRGVGQSLPIGASDDIEKITMVSAKHESILTFMDRLKSAQSAQKLIIRLSEPYRSAQMGSAFDQSVDFSGYDWETINASVEDHLREKTPELRLRQIPVESGGFALLVTNNQQFNNKLPRVFTVEQGKLSENAAKMAKFWGWSAPAEFWMPERDFKLSSGFDIVTTDILDGFKNLMKDFPVQAQLVVSQRSVIVVGRNSKTRKGKQHAY